MFVCKPDNPLAGSKSVTLTSLAELDFVGPLPGWTALEAVDRIFAAAGQRRRVVFEVNDILTTLDFVAYGLGVTLAVESAAAIRPDLRAIPLADPAMTWTLAAVAHRHHATPAARAFLSLLPEFRTDGGMPR
jgi:DNA-binding transcriptional LysR family regulator